jgi:hypothetical protein
MDSNSQGCAVMTIGAIVSPLGESTNKKARRFRRA